METKKKKILWGILTLKIPHRKSKFQYSTVTVRQSSPKFSKTINESFKGLTDLPEPPAPKLEDKSFAHFNFQSP